jgi:hypothetical protein
MALKKVGALWLAEKDGKQYMRGTLNDPLSAGTKVFVYRNTYKKEDKQPDYTLHAAVDDEQHPEEQSQEQPESDVPF